MAHFLTMPISASGPLDRVLAEPLPIDELAASVLGAYADELVERAQPRRFTVQGRMNNWTTTPESVREAAQKLHIRSRENNPRRHTDNHIVAIPPGQELTEGTAVPLLYPKSGQLPAMNAYSITLLGLIAATNILRAAMRAPPSARPSQRRSPPPPWPPTRRG